MPEPPPRLSLLEPPLTVPVRVTPSAMLKVSLPASPLRLAVALWLTLKTSLPSPPLISVTVAVAALMLKVSAAVPPSSVWNAEKVRLVLPPSLYVCAVLPRVQVLATFSPVSVLPEPLPAISTSMPAKPPLRPVAPLLW